MLHDHPQAAVRSRRNLIALQRRPNDHWTLRLLADQVVELGVVQSLSYETVRLRLKKTPSSRGGSSSGIPKVNGELWPRWNVPGWVQRTLRLPVVWSSRAPSPGDVRPPLGLQPGRARTMNIAAADLQHLRLRVAGLTANLATEHLSRTSPTRCAGWWMWPIPMPQWSAWSCSHRMGRCPRPLHQRKPRLLGKFGSQRLMAISVLSRACLIAAESADLQPDPTPW